MPTTNLRFTMVRVLSARVPFLIKYVADDLQEQKFEFVGLRFTA